MTGQKSASVNADQKTGIMDSGEDGEVVDFNIKKVSICIAQTDASNASCNVC